jgi:predicted ATP-binding protein involved in virulence
MSIEKYKQAWEKFQNKMVSLKKRKHEILKTISEKLDKQHIEVLRKKIENNE